MKKKSKLSQKDKKSWEDFLKNPLNIEDKEKSKTEINKFSRFKFDLHGFTLDDANRKVRDIILSCVKKNYKEILFITGKGIHSTNESDVYTSKDFGKLIKLTQEEQQVVNQVFPNLTQNYFAQFQNLEAEVAKIIISDLEKERTAKKGKRGQQRQEDQAKRDAGTFRRGR